MALGYRISAKGADRAEILIYEDVGEGWFGGVSAKQFADDLKALGAVSTIDVRINSYGGDVFDGFAMYRQLVEHKARIVVHVDGVAASIASVIAMAGDEIEIAAPGFVMVHDAWGLGVGNAAELRSVADRLETISGAIADVYVARTGKPAATVRGWMTAETWFTADEAVAAGLATKVAENATRLAAAFNPAMHRFARMPSALASPVAPSAPIRPAPRPSFDGAAAQIQRMRAARDHGRIQQTRARA